MRNHFWPARDAVLHMDCEKAGAELTWLGAIERRNDAERWLGWHSSLVGRRLEWDLTDLVLGLLPSGFYTWDSTETNVPSWSQICPSIQHTCFGPGKQLRLSLTSLLNDSLLPSSVLQEHSIRSIPSFHTLQVLLFCVHGVVSSIFSAIIKQLLLTTTDAWKSCVWLKSPSDLGRIFTKTFSNHTVEVMETQPPHQCSSILCKMKFSFWGMCHNF